MPRKSNKKPLDPVARLELLSNGVDYRKSHPLVLAVLTHAQSNIDEPPDPDEWARLVSLAEANQYSDVPIRVSMQATQALADRTQAKLKTRDGDSGHTSAQVTPLTPEEMETFEQWYRRHF